MDTTTLERPQAQQAIGQIAVDLPGATAIFRRLKLDFCCGGNVPLHEAATSRGLDAAPLGQGRPHDLRHGAEARRYRQR